MLHHLPVAHLAPTSCRIGGTLSLSLSLSYCIDGRWVSDFNQPHANTFSLAALEDIYRAPKAPQKRGGSRDHEWCPRVLFFSINMNRDAHAVSTLNPQTGVSCGSTHDVDDDDDDDKYFTQHARAMEREIENHTHKELARAYALPIICAVCMYIEACRRRVDILPVHLWVLCRCKANVRQLTSWWIVDHCHVCTSHA